MPFVLLLASAVTGAQCLRKAATVFVVPGTATSIELPLPKELAHIPERWRDALNSPELRNRLDDALRADSPDCRLYSSLRLAGPAPTYSVRVAQYHAEVQYAWSNNSSVLEEPDAETERSIQKKNRELLESARRVITELDLIGYALELDQLLQQNSAHTAQLQSQYDCSITAHARNSLMDQKRVSSMLSGLQSAFRDGRLAGFRSIHMTTFWRLLKGKEDGGAGGQLWVKLAEADRLDQVLRVWSSPRISSAR